MVNLFISFAKEEFNIETHGNYIQWSFKHFEQNISYKCSAVDCQAQDK